MIKPINVTPQMIEALKAEAEASGDARLTRDCEEIMKNPNAFRRVVAALRERELISREPVTK